MILLQSKSLALIITALIASFGLAQRPQPKPSPDDIGFAHGTIQMETPGLRLEFIKDSQTLVGLTVGIFAKAPEGVDVRSGVTPPDWTSKLYKKLSAEGTGRSPLTGIIEPHNFLPIDRQAGRNANGYYQFGDLNLRLKEGQSEWKSFSSAAKRAPVKMIRSESGVLASDLAASFPPDFPLQVTRTWSIQNGHLNLSFTIKNPTNHCIEIGGLGIPLVLNNIISDRNLKEAHEKCAFSDQYIGKDAGYVQVTRLSGQGPALVIVPQRNSPLEAYHLLNEPTRPNQTFEGMFEWMVHSSAYAENEWKTASQWNVPSSSFLPAGESTTVGLQFLVSPSIRDIEKTLIANHRPVAVGIPGYILPQGQKAKLFVNYNKPIKSLEVEPAGALTAKIAEKVKGGYVSIDVNGTSWGRARLTITYADRTEQTVHYDVTKSAGMTVGDMGRFLNNQQWFTDTTDPFHRAPSYISYDREAKQQVTQDSRVWISGLGDEGGSGSFVAAAMKN
ncbi:MAG: DUF5695 domain-containing protein, partial [Armatimonadota bacterium]